jgi:general secretion pathway protein D/MSHA biogenesis protein MshL
MKLRSKIAPLFVLITLSLALLSCSPLTAKPEKSTAEAIKSEAAKVTTSDITPPALPVQYQKPSYLVAPTGKDELDSQADDVALKVGAKISSTKKVPLREIMKPLASQKKLNISWASDVNQDALVDVDIKADDDFYQAIDNLLRQVDYFYEKQGSTVIIKYRETKQFHIAMPFTKQDFSTGAGGNVLGGDVGGEGIAKNVEGTIKLVSEKNEFDIWKNVTSNLDIILKIERTKKTTTLKSEGETDEDVINKRDTKKTNSRTSAKSGYKESTTKEVVEEVTGGEDNYYLVDKPVGLITVTAPRPILAKIDAYFTSLQKEIYKQISIEAKIIEVQLIDNSSIGINWNAVLKNFSIDGAVQFGAQALDPASGITQIGQVFPYIFANENGDGKWDNGRNHGSTYDPTRLVSNVRINTANFDVFLNALKTQGNTKVLSNPKISVLNGQPSMITVGQNITYIDKIEVDVDTETNTRTYTAETARVLSGVGLALTATVLNNNEIIMNLVPVTSELQGEIEYRQVGEGEVGLPIVNVREMSTTVRVKDGEMLVIGGLISDVNEEKGNFAPVVGDIPLVKYLFGYEEKVKNKRELIILLKPRII